ncbi:MAG: YicC family protein [Methylophilaceae bacterium]|nr:YicC family protein [Methylophilaceae bacterium]
MTGFSFQEIKLKEGKLTIEIRTLNSRFFELQLRLGEELREFEPKIREMIASKIIRGKVDCRVFYKTSDESNQVEQPINIEKLKKLLKKIDTVNGVLKSSLEIDPLRVFEILTSQPNQINTAFLKTDLFRFLNKGIGMICVDREREGKKIRAVILSNVKAIKKIVTQAKKVMPRLINKNMRTITSRLKENLIDANDERIKQELLFFIQKSDINEEIDRLESHIEEITRLLSLKTPIGKKMDFLMQEFNREANTIGSKAAGIEISNMSINLKVCIEQIREQTQNIQ